MPLFYLRRTSRRQGTLTFFGFFDACLFNKINGFDLLRPAVFVENKIFDRKSIYEMVTFKNPNGDFDINNRNFMLKLLG